MAIENEIVLEGAAAPLNEQPQQQSAKWDSDSDQEPRGSERSGSNCLDIYLTEIGRLKRLTPEEERELARRIKQGDAEARDEMIKANLRLVVKLAKEYENLGVPLLDLISEGNIGLVKAAERYDESYGTRFSTY